MRKIPAKYAAVKVGDQFGSWRIIGEPYFNDARRTYLILARCGCGKEKAAIVYELLNERTKTCGCERNAKLVRHGHSVRKNGQQSKTYSCYCSMITRCHNPNATCYSNYGGRGITVCDRWRESFVNFLADMGPVPQGMQIERIDNDNGYSPDNCTWSTRKEQSRNKRSTRWITAFGETHTLSEWAEMREMDADIIGSRINRRGWSSEEALQPVGWKRQTSYLVTGVES